MQVAPETELISHYAPERAERPIALPEIGARSRTYALVAIMALGLALRLYDIGAYSFVGDEYNSLAEAQSLGLNWNSIVYSFVLHVWMWMGSSEAWLRLPAALFGVATIPLMSRVGAKLGGWRTGAVAALLAATSPFNIFHSQEVRFYSLFMFATAGFLLATVHYTESARTLKLRMAVIGSALLLLVSHFLGVVALGAQGAATFLAAKRRKLATVLIVGIGVPLLLFALPLLPPVREILFALYRAFGNAEGASGAATPISLISFAKIGFVGFTFVFGYHVYPLGLLLVVPGALLSAFLLMCGAVRLFQQRKWAGLALTYGVALAGVYLVLDSIGGRVASRVSPRHVAFVWPVFILLIAFGLARFRQTTFRLLLLALLAVNIVSLTYGWRKDWSYGPATDYRAAAEYASRQATPTTGLVFVGRVAGAVDVYFPKNLARVDCSPFFLNGEATPLVRNDRLIFVSDDWEASRRQRADRLLHALSSQYTHVEGRVDYPLFEYALSRDGAPARSTDRTVSQLQQPFSIYGVEFQDLKLPVNVTAQGATLQVSGAAELPNADGENVVTLSVPATAASRLVLLTSVTRTQSLADGAAIADVVVESKSKVIGRFPLRLGVETAAWDVTCPSYAGCQTVFQWHKRMAMTGQNSYPDAWRDFQAGMHAVTLDLPTDLVADKISLHYTATSGRLYLWAAAVR